MRFGTWNVRSLYTAGSLTAAARELARYKLDLVNVQEVRWDIEGTVKAGDYRKLNSSFGNTVFLHHIIVLVVKREEFVSSRVSYIVLSDRWCNIIVLNVDATSEDKSDDSKDSFYEELEQVFYYFPEYHTKIILGDFNAKWGEIII
jgi:exonuclease III